MSIEAGAWKDPSAWGLFLADLARHISAALQGARGLPQEESLRQIAHMFSIELAHPTDAPSGQFS